MSDRRTTAQSIDEYIRQFPPDVQERLNKLRAVIQAAAPDAEEKISWQMPTFAQYGNVVHFAAYKNHIGLYPGASGIEAFQQELSDYKSARGSVQFQLAKPLPYDLVSRIVKFRVAENIADHEKQVTAKPRGGENPDRAATNER